ncbi:MAG: Gfo/Idh/MocA family oxidoreductase [Planctomycetota bacterium]
MEPIPGVKRTFPLPPAPVQKGLGVLGLHEGATLLTALARATRIRAVAGCDREEKKLAEVRRRAPELFLTTSYAEMLARPEVEIVAVYTPDAHHAEHVAAAFEAGKDVICTKPLVNSSAGARRLLASARATGRKLLVGQSTRFFEPFLRQRAAFERNEVGELELLDAHYVHRMDWFYDKSPWAVTETDWTFLGLSHPVDLAYWYLGPIATVHAFGHTSSLGRRYGLTGYDVYMANLRARDGRIGRVMGHYGLAELPTARNAIELLLFGSAGTSLAQYHDMRFVHTSPDGTEVTQDPLYALRHHYFNSEAHGMHYGEFANYAEHFAGALIDGTPHAPDLEDGLETFCTMEAIRRSARIGGETAVDAVRAEVFGC